MNKPNYSFDAEEHSYVENLSDIAEEDAREFLNVGIDTDETNRSATFILKDLSVVHCKTRQEGVEVMRISKAMKKYDGLKEYMWKGLSPEKDDFTKLAKDKPSGGFFIRCAPGVKTRFPVQTCLHLSKEGMTQNVHNILVAEENSDIHVIAGCSTSPHLDQGQHVGVSEFYVKKGASLTYTMIHDWGSNIVVRPRTVTYVEEGGTYISNYISLKPVGSLETNPITYLNGKGAVARFNSILVAAEGTYLDTGSQVVLNAEDTRAEIISRAITTGGTVIARGNINGKFPGVKGHLECKGLILKDGLLHAIPELEAEVPGVEMSHEAAVGKIDRREIEYLMARGLDEETAISTIVRGFLNVDIEGLPAELAEKLDKAIAETEHDMM